MTVSRPGLLCPVTTPFSARGDADPARLRSQIEIYARLGVDGIVLFGTSGEGPLIDSEEEEPLLAVARAALGSDRTLAVQVGHESVRATLASASRAEAAGTRTPWMRDGEIGRSEPFSGAAQWGTIRAQSPRSSARPPSKSAGAVVKDRSKVVMAAR